MESDAEDPKVQRKAEVLDPLPTDGAGGPVDVLAIIATYTERPDLLLEVVEKHDPGFIKRMNENAEAGAAEFRESRFRFGRNQAYMTLLVQVVAAFTILAFVGYVSYSGKLSFWLLIGFAVFYAVAQGGRGGFIEIARGLAGLLARKGLDRSDH